VAKCHTAISAAAIFNQAMAAENHQAIQKFLSFGLEVVMCAAIGDYLILELRYIGQGSNTITLYDVPAAFVAR
jgi:hypothetical protein